MNITQLEYILAVNQLRHFAQAAAFCHVTQPTLSMQIQKLERELGVKIFDRSKQPVIPTAQGHKVIEQARKIIAEVSALGELCQQQTGLLSGELKVGIIPTLAPYLLPLFVQGFTKKYRQVKLIVAEITTDVIISRLKEGKIDAGILVTPLQEAGIKEHPLFYEELVVYSSLKNEALKKQFVLAKDINPAQLWLLEEGHCFRSQIVQLCELKKASIENRHFEYEAGSIETLLRMVEINDGITIIPELAALQLAPAQQKQIRSFKSPPPYREISLAVYRDDLKKRLTDLLKKEILASLPKQIRTTGKLKVLPVVMDNYQKNTSSSG